MNAASTSCELVAYRLCQKLWTLLPGHLCLRQYLAADCLIWRSSLRQNSAALPLIWFAAQERQLAACQRED